MSRLDGRAPYVKRLGEELLYPEETAAEETEGDEEEGVGEEGVDGEEEDHCG